MNCPFCSRRIDAMTGFQEADKFQKHLGRCRKNPNNVTLRDGHRSATTPVRHQTLKDALELRAASRQ